MNAYEYDGFIYTAVTDGIETAFNEPLTSYPVES
jgi:hypothetical protein